jgi:formate hydrogenlyase transcriptional activator
VILSAGPVLNVPLGEIQSRPAATAANRNGDSDNERGPTTRQDIRNVLEETERRHILGVLSQTNWVVAGPNGAATRLGMKRSTLQLRMRKLGLTRENARATV